MTLLNRKTVILGALGALFFLLSLPLGAADQKLDPSKTMDKSTSDLENDLFGADTQTVQEEKNSNENMTDSFLKNDQGVKWGGYLNSDVSLNGGWIDNDQFPSESSDKTWRDNLGVNFWSNFYLDARPKKELRVKLALRTAWPFTNKTTVSTPDTTTYPTGQTTVTSPNIKIWEIFSDLTIQDSVFIRVGKQVNSWGVSYFFSPGDVISLTAKDPLNPTLEREGPVAAKVSVPFPAQGARVTGYLLAKDEFFTNQQTIREVGYALKGEWLVKKTEFGLGGFYQRSLAPKAVATMTSGLGYFDIPFISDLSVVSENVINWGSDKQLGLGTSSSGAFSTLDKPSTGLYYQGVQGISYSNSEWNFGARIEYYFNGFGSNDLGYARRAWKTYQQAQSNSAYSLSDAMDPSMHKIAGLITFTSINSTKLDFQCFWQQSLSDQSGMFQPKFTFTPWTYFAPYAGFTYVYGNPDTEFALLNQDFNTGLVKRVTLFIGANIGTGSF